MEEGGIDISNMWKPLVGGLVGGLINTVTTAIANQIQADARRRTAETLNRSNEKLSGLESFNRAAQSGIAEGIDQQNEAQNLAASISQTGSSRMGNAMNAMNDVNNNNQFNQGFNAAFGRSRSNDQNAMDRARTMANNQMSQADEEAGAYRQAGQTILDTVGGAASLYNQIGLKPSNESRLVPAMPSQGVGI